MRVSHIVASKAKIPLQATTCAALAALPGAAGGMVDPGESPNNEQPGRLFRSSSFKSALAPLRVGCAVNRTDLNEGSMAKCWGVTGLFFFINFH